MGSGKPREASLETPLEEAPEDLRKGFHFSVTTWLTFSSPEEFALRAWAPFFEQLRPIVASCVPSQNHSPIGASSFPKTSGRLSSNRDNVDNTAAERQKNLPRYSVKTFGSFPLAGSDVRFLSQLLSGLLNEVTSSSP